MDTPSNPGGSAGDGKTPAMPDTPLTRALRNITRNELVASDICVTSIKGVLAEDAGGPAEGPPAFVVLLAIAGSGRTRIEGVDALELAGGMGAVFWSRRHVRGFDQLDGGQPIEAVEMRFPSEYPQQLVGAAAGQIRNVLLVDRSDRTTGTILVGLPLSNAMIDIARAILLCPLAAGPLRDVYVRAKAHEALALVLDALSRMSPAALRLSHQDRLRVQDARHLLDTRMSEPWTISTLASAVGLSESKLKIGFRGIVGHSVRAYLREVRIEQAAALIRSGEAVTEAALATGFHNLSHFSKAFRSLKGVGPRQYAKRSRVGGA